MYLRIRSKALAAVVRGGVTLAVTTDEIKSNRVPVLALVGEEDPIHEKVRIMTTLMPKVKLVVIPGANHMTAYGRPEFRDELARFLAEHSTRAGDKQRPPMHE
ncbi:MAG: alpha/beta hydrolase [Planctomycetota bacterium]